MLNAEEVLGFKGLIVIHPHLKLWGQAHCVSLSKRSGCRFPIRPTTFSKQPGKFSGKEQSSSGTVDAFR